MKLKLSCRYCGFIEIRAIYSEHIDQPKCLKCGDENLDIKQHRKASIDYYQGSPPFKGDKPYLYGEGEE